MWQRSESSRLLKALTNAAARVGRERQAGPEIEPGTSPILEGRAITTLPSRFVEESSTPTARAPWLKIIITSRHDDDIQNCFNAPTPSTHLGYDLTEDKETTSDLRIFARNRFSKVAPKWRLQAWPEPSLLEETISRAAGLFIFIFIFIFILLLLTLRRTRRTPPSA
jgi:hypothetical protein